MSENSANPFIIAPAVCQQIDHWLTKYPADQKRSAVVPALLLIQQQNQGWLSEAAMEACADYLGLPKIAVFEVATFYDMFELKPVGKHKINICTNVACMLRGAELIADNVKEHLGIEFGETTPDGLFTLRESECLAACGGAPMCQINDKVYYENLTTEKILSLIDGLATKTTDEVNQKKGVKDAT